MRNSKKAITYISNYWLPVIVWSLFIYSFSSRQVPVSSQVFWQDFVVKKTAHLIEYAILAILYFRALISSGLSRKKAAILAIALCLLYGISDEFHQRFTPGRTPRVTDVVVDTLGSVLGIWKIWFILPKAPKKIREWAQKLEIG